MFNHCNWLIVILYSYSYYIKSLYCIIFNYIILNIINIIYIWYFILVYYSYFIKSFIIHIRFKCFSSFYTSLGRSWNTNNSETTNSGKRSGRSSLHFLCRGRSSRHIYFPSFETWEDEEIVGHRNGTCRGRNTMDKESDCGETKFGKCTKCSRTIIDASGKDRETKINGSRRG